MAVADGQRRMDVKVVYVDPNGTLSVLPETEAAGAGATPLLRSPPSVSLAAAYLTLSSAAIAANAMVLTGVVAADRLRTPYAVLASALCLQCALDATVGHCAATRELLQLSAGGGDGGGGGGGGPILCRAAATVAAALPVVQLVTFASLVSLGALIRPGYDELPLSVAAALWAAPSVYTYVILTPTLLFSVRYFPSRCVPPVTGSARTVQCSTRTLRPMARSRRPPLRISNGRLKFAFVLRVYVTVRCGSRVVHESVFFLGYTSSVMVSVRKR